MARVDKLEHIKLDHVSSHSPVACTYDVVTDESGQRCLQLDTYGSSERKLIGKKSQSIRLTPAAIAELKSIIAKHGL